MNILINAYACAPNMGSEPGMAWNWIINLARYCRVFVITEGEWRYEIERELEKLPQKESITFYFSPVSPRIRKMCWNQGDWRFYFYYKKWQKEALEIAKNITVENQIEIIHQLNMIGFREPGYLWKLNKPFIWGPIGGMKNFPLKYLIGSDPKMMFFMVIKNVINNFQIKYDGRVKLAVNNSKILISAIPETQFALLKHYNKQSILIPETGTYDKTDFYREEDFFIKNKTFDLLWVGKFDFRKRLDLAVKTLSTLKHLKNIRLRIVGSGTRHQIKKYQALTKKLGIEDMVVWEGLLPNRKVMEIMQNSHLFFFTSVSEDTSTVVLEAISNHLPVLCFNTCGFGPIVDSSVGVKIELKDPKLSVKEFSSEIESLYNNRSNLIRFSNNCAEKKRNISWDVKALQMVELYKASINK